MRTSGRASGTAHSCFSSSSRRTETQRIHIKCGCPCDPADSPPSHRFLPADLSKTFLSFLKSYLHWTLGKCPTAQTSEGCKEGRNVGKIPNHKREITRPACLATVMCPTGNKNLRLVCMPRWRPTAPQPIAHTHAFSSSVCERENLANQTAKKNGHTQNASLPLRSHIQLYPNCMHLNRHSDKPLWVSCRENNLPVNGHACAQGVRAKSGFCIQAHSAMHGIGNPWAIGTRISESFFDLFVYCCLLFSNSIYRTGLHSFIVKKKDANSSNLTTMSSTMVQLLVSVFPRVLFLQASKTRVESAPAEVGFYTSGRAPFGFLHKTPQALSYTWHFMLAKIFVKAQCFCKGICKF